MDEQLTKGGSSKERPLSKDQEAPPPSTPLFSPGP